ncbi:30S ribosomal protein S12 methylthiotransferase RimO [Candidatus Omnitrophota bacterium]
MKIKIGILSLGCARNLVDSEVILGWLKEAGFGIVEEIAQSDIALVNTCCFVRPAQEETIETILEICRLKARGQVKKIVVCGCLVQRHKQKLLKLLPEVDAFVDVGSIQKIVSVLKRLLKDEQGLAEFAPAEFLYSHLSPREFITPKHFAYLKVSEGCNNRCSYCVIPSLRGRHRSRDAASILKEADLLIKQRRVKEINLIGQDTTMYGEDLTGSLNLAELLRKLAQKAKGRWIRLLYTHPAHFSDQLIQVIKREQPICKYIDLPIQHINDKILKLMRRKTSTAQILRLLDALRQAIPNLCLRTTLMVGFPQETDRQFRELLDFMRQVKFERLGLFKYSPEEDTPAAKLSGQVPERVKQARFNQALGLQQQIARGLNQKFLGQTLRVLVDEQDSQDRGQFIGRTQFDAPEVDGCVYLRSKKGLKVGTFVRAEIVDTLEYDLVGRAG